MKIIKELQALEEGTSIVTLRSYTVTCFGQLLSNYDGWDCSKDGVEGKVLEGGSMELKLWNCEKGVVKLPDGFTISIPLIESALVDDMVHEYLIPFSAFLLELSEPNIMFIIQATSSKNKERLSDIIKDSPSKADLEPE
jgi:hypothetical protein